MGARKVEILKNKYVTGGHLPVGKEGTGVFGTFIQYSMGYEEFETGPGNFATAIVELDDGSVLNEMVEFIKFVK